MTKVPGPINFPALTESKSVSNPDLLNIADKNYTSTILKYAGLAVKFPQLVTDAKTLVAAINEVKGGKIKLEPATADKLGAIKVGAGLSITSDGTLSSQGGGSAITTTSITLMADRWSDNIQIVSVPGITTTNSVLVSPTPNNLDEYAKCQVYGSAQGQNSLTFTCTDIPEHDLSVNIAYWE